MRSSGPHRGHEPSRVALSRLSRSIAETAPGRSDSSRAIRRNKGVICGLASASNSRSCMLSANRSVIPDT